MDKDWVDFCMPRMMEQMQQMSEEFKRKKMVEMISENDFNHFKQVLDSIGQSAGQKSNEAKLARQMMGALAMKKGSGRSGASFSSLAANDVQSHVDPIVQKNRLIIQMRNNLRQKYQVSNL